MRKPIILKQFLGPATREALVKLADRRSVAWELGRRNTGYEKYRLDDWNMYLGTRLLVPNTFKALVECLWQRALHVLGAEKNHGQDVFLLRYPTGAWIDPHTDGSEDDADTDYDLIRLNAVVEAADAGGELLIRGRPVRLEPGDAVIFYADRWKHAVTKVEQGRRLVFTAGAFV